MDLKQSVKAASLNKSTYINLRWIGILGQFITINTVNTQTTITKRIYWNN